MKVSTFECSSCYIIFIHTILGVSGRKSGTSADLPVRWTYIPVGLKPMLKKKAKNEKKNERKIKQKKKRHFQGKLREYAGFSDKAVKAVISCMRV